MREFLQVGVICAAHGINGAVRVRLFHSSSKVFKKDLLVYLVDKFTLSRSNPLKITEASSMGSRGWLLSFEGLIERTDAEKLINLFIEVKKKDIPALAKDEVYLADLIGCFLVDLQEKKIGTVTKILNFGAQDILVGELLSEFSDDLVTNEVMIPFVDAIVKQIDLKQGKIWLDLPEGLLELNKKS